MSMEHFRAQTMVATVLLGGSVPVSAEVVFDGTTGGPTGMLSGDITITQNDGLVTPGNDALLHSFELFNVLAGESVSFSHSTQTINNILLRVTGTQPSLLDGRLVSDANLWLLNPNGVLRGTQASLDIAGSFLANSLNGDGAALILNDGSSFSVDTNLNTLAVARPADFGFVADTAQGVIADTSLGTVSSSTPQGDGQLFSISGGSIAGANLFHSFEQFSVFEGDTAEFTAPAGDATSIANVISRVTGNNQSFLTGTVRTSGAGLAGASFWLVNPAGMFVGNDIQFDVGRGLHLGVAHGVRTFNSENQSLPFFSQPSLRSDLFAGEPDGFFISAGSKFGDLRVNGLDFNQQDRLGSATADGITLFGDNVTIINSSLRLETASTRKNELKVIAPIGTVKLSDSTIQGLTSVDENRGRVKLLGAHLVSNGTTIELATSATAGDTRNRRVIESSFSDSVSLVDTELRTSTSGASSTGGIVFFTPAFSMDGGVIESRSTSVGRTDNIGVEPMGPGAGIRLSGGAQFRLDNRNATNNQVGSLMSERQIVLRTEGDVELFGSIDEPIELLVDAGPRAGANGSILVEGQSIVADHLRASATTESTVAPVPEDSDGQFDPEVPSMTEDTGIFLSSRGKLELANSSLSITTSGVINAGTLGLVGEEISLNNVDLASSTTGEGNAGSLTVGVPETILQSDGSVGLVATSSLNISNSRITADTDNRGNGAAIALSSANTVSLDEVSIGVSSTAAVDGGAAGRIEIFSFGDINANHSDISATNRSGRPGAVGLFGGNITLTDVEILADSDSTKSGTAIPGSLTSFGVSIPASVSVNTSGRLTISESNLSASVSGDGNSLGLSLTAPQVGIFESSVSATSTGPGDAGGVLISAVDLSIASRGIDRRTTVSTNSALSRGGDIVVQSSGFSQLLNSDLIASAGAEGTGGNVQVDLNGGTLIVANSTLLAQAENGSGGAIDINPTLAAQIFIDGQSVLNADSANGTSGSVLVDSPDTGIVSALSQQEAALAPEARLEQDACNAASRSTNASSLYVREASSQDVFAAGYLGATGRSKSAQRNCR